MFQNTGCTSQNTSPVSQNSVGCSGTPQVVAKNDEYQELFGDRASTTLSIYEHKHDHTHSPDGTIKRKQ